MTTTKGHPMAEAWQANLIAEIRSCLSGEENERASDRLIWQRAVKFGPNDPAGHAESLRNALTAADSYGDELMRELGLEPPFATPEVEEGVSGSGLTDLVEEFRLRGREENLTEAQRACWQHAAMRLEQRLQALAAPEPSDTPPASVPSGEPRNDQAKWLRQLADDIEATTEWMAGSWLGAESDPDLLRQLAAESTSVPSGGDGEECDSCEDSGIYQEGDEWAPCGDCDRGREIAHYLKAATDEIRGERDSRLTKGAAGAVRNLLGLRRQTESGSRYYLPDSTDVRDALEEVAAAFEGEAP